jgi:hypothetical protein
MEIIHHRDDEYSIIGLSYNDLSMLVGSVSSAETLLTSFTSELSTYETKLLGQIGEFLTVAGEGSGKQRKNSDDKVAAMRWRDRHGDVWEEKTPGSDQWYAYFDCECFIDHSGVMGPMTLAQVRKDWGPVVLESH